MELTYKTCWECSKLKEEELHNYMRSTDNVLIYEFINKMLCDMIMQQWECYTCPPFTIEMYCKAALTNYYGKKPPKAKNNFTKQWENANEEEKNQLKKFLQKAKKGILTPIERTIDTSIIDNIKV